MRNTASILAGLIGATAASPAVMTAEPTQPKAFEVFNNPNVDGNWHIGCDNKDHCSFYQGAVATAAAANEVFNEATTTCKRCITMHDDCEVCALRQDRENGFQCITCDHWECFDTGMKDALCVDVPTQLLEALSKETATAASGIILPRIVAAPTTQSVTGTGVATLADSEIVTGNWHIGCDNKDHCSFYQDAATAAAAADQGIVRKFVPAEWSCQECTADEPCEYCPGEYFDCENCEHWQCNEKFLQNYDCIDVPPELAQAIYNETYTTQPAIIETTTALSTATTTVLSTDTTTALSTATVTMLSAATVTLLSEATTTMQDTTTVHDPATTTTDTITVSDLVSANVTVTDTVTVTTTTTVFSRITSKTPPIVQATETTYTDVKSVESLWSSNASANGEPRASHAATPLSRRDIFGCVTCPGAEACNLCDFTCDDCEQMYCDTTAINDETYCIEMSVSEPREFIEAGTIPQHMSKSLPRAASLHIREISTKPTIGSDDATDAAAPTDNSTNVADVTSTYFPVDQSGARPTLEFNEDLCVDCGLHGEKCSECDWQFNCGKKSLCAFNGAREIVELCYEIGEKCQ